MFPDRVTAINRQRGAALAMAVFIIVVLSLVGLSLVSLLNKSTEATVSDVLGTRAEFAAKSAINGFLVSMFDTPDTINGASCEARNDTSVGPNQNDSTPNNYSFAADAQGLSQCEVAVYCDTININQRNHYRIEAIAACEAGGLNYSRNLLVEVSDAVL